MRIHFIAVGGSVMHNLAIELSTKGHAITGSDDEIYDPSKSKLERYGLLPEVFGWYPEKNISPELDAVVLGMHARADNPELKKANELGIPVYSFPEFVYERSKEKTRVVVAGSHGKTTTTSMIMHVLLECGRDFDYLVGAALEGFELMVRLSDAPVIIIEGDEYLSSALDRRSKFLHYKPHISILTGIAWDHVNVFPTFEGYLDTFRQYLQTIPEEGILFHYSNDDHIPGIIKEGNHSCRTEAYSALDFEAGKDGLPIVDFEGQKYPLKVFGKHNLENLKAAYLVCRELGIPANEILDAFTTFGGAAKRLQHLGKAFSTDIFLDFAHAPSKAKATTEAVASLHPHRKLTACLELHTFSSLNKAFHPQYSGTLDKAEQAFVFYSEHTLKMKKLPWFTPEELGAQFNHPNLRVFTDSNELEEALRTVDYMNRDLLMMSSGHFGGMDVKQLAEDIITKQKPQGNKEVEFLDIGRIPYKEGWDYQFKIHDALKAVKKFNRDKSEEEEAKEERQVLIFCDHPHVYTLGKSGSMDNLLLNEAQLKDKGIDFLPINRGGDITYHGPGQIVGYPILNLENFFADIHKYVRLIEETIIQVLQDYGIGGMRIEGLSGVWLEAEGFKPKRKICAVGIHLSRWVTMHGFAFNVNTDLSLFNNIIPCGIADDDKAVTSLSNELGVGEMDMDEVKEKVRLKFGELMGIEWV